MSSVQQRYLLGDDALDDEEGTTHDPWAEYNWAAVDKIYRYTACLSILGSGFVICHAFGSKEQRQKAYNRIIGALSVYDLLMSIWLFLGKWVQPEKSWDALSGNRNTDRHGTIGTCEASGFFIVLGSTAIPLYNSVLSTFFLLSICYNWREERLVKSFERYAHPTIAIIAIIIAIIPIPLNLYNPFHFYCYTSVDGYISPGIYERGTLLANHVYIYMDLVVVSLSSIYVAVVMIIIYHNVRKMESRIGNRSFVSTVSRRRISWRTNWSGTATTSNRRSSSFITEERRNKYAKSRAVAITAFLYVIPFYLTWIIPSVWNALTNARWHGQLPLKGGSRPFQNYVMAIWISTFYPLQGFFNAVIYAMPMIRKLKITSFIDKLLCCGKKENDQDQQPNTFGTANVRGEGDEHLSIELGTVVKNGASDTEDNFLENNEGDQPNDLGGGGCREADDTSNELGSKENDVVNNGAGGTPPSSGDGNSSEDLSEDTFVDNM